MLGFLMTQEYQEQSTALRVIIRERRKAEREACERGLRIPPLRRSQAQLQEEREREEEEERRWEQEELEDKSDQEPAQGGETDEEKRARIRRGKRRKMQPQQRQ